VLNNQHATILRLQAFPRYTQHATQTGQIMAARKHHQRKVVLNDHSGWKDAIKTTLLTKRLQAFVNSEVELTPSQVTAALGLLRKTAPDLSAVALGQDEDKGPVQITWSSK
jgi:hypothetical protein